MSAAVRLDGCGAFDADDRMLRRLQFTSHEMNRESEYPGLFKWRSEMTINTIEAKPTPRYNPNVPAI